MKILLFILLLTHCVISNGETTKNRFAISYNLLTMHTFDRQQDFKNKIDNKGIFMYNPIIVLKYNKSNFMIGKDSVDSTMFGYYHEINKFIIGAYSHNLKDWKRATLTHQLSLRIKNEFGIIPIIGIKQNLFKKDNIISDLIITPLTINLTFGFSF